MDRQLEAARLSAGYGRGDVLQEVSFTLYQGEICAVLGPNGSGKSTLLLAVCGLLPSRGRCLLKGRDLSRMTHRQVARQMAYLGQRGGTALSLSALDVVLMGYSPVLGPFQRVNSHQRNQALHALGQVGAGPLAHADFLTLSEGQRQLVLFARTLLRPVLLTVLDEPDSALDFSNRRQIYQLLKTRARETGQSVLLCSHDVNLALGYADRLLCLKGGRLVHDLTVSAASKDALTAALGDLYGPVEIVGHKGSYLMTGAV